MALLKSGLVLAENENLVMELEAELWAASSNPIARAFGWLKKLYYFLFGIRVHGYVVITDRRVVEVRDRKACWVFNVSKEIKYILPNSVKEIGYTKAGTICGCFCQAYHLYYEGHTEKTAIMLKGVDEKGAQKIVDSFYAAIATPNHE